jgi:hypothetical protein
MQHEELPPPGLLPPSLLDHMDALWPSLSTDDKRALRLCCTEMRDAVDAHVIGLDGPRDATVLSQATCARLPIATALTLRSMACLRGMVPPQPGGGFPRLQSLRLLLDEVRMGCALDRAWRPCIACLAWLGARPPA